MNKTPILLVQSRPISLVQSLQIHRVDNKQRVWIMFQVEPIKDLTTILAYRQLHLPVFVRSPSFELWQLFRFGAGFAALALAVLMVVLLLLLFVEPLLQTAVKRRMTAKAAVVSQVRQQRLLLYYYYSY